jgi:DNA replication protein DnaC
MGPERLGLNDDPEPLQAILDRIRERRPDAESMPVTSEPVCSMCGGLGWVYPTNESRVMYGRAIPCQCRATEARGWHVRLSHLPTDDASRLTNFEQRPGTHEAYAAAVLMAEGNPAHHILTLAGAPGTGKSHLARGIGWAWIEKARGTVLYYKVVNLLDDLRKGYDQKPEHPGEASGFDRLLTRVYQVKLLILDDLGIEKSTEWTMDKLDTIIDHRYENRMATVITTNLAPSALSDRVQSRLKEGITVRIKATDYREIKAKQRR